MIIKGNPRSGADFWAAHLMRTDQNESVSISEIRGLSAGNIKGCLDELQAIAEGTRTKNGFYVASLNPREGEQLTPEQWEKAADILEQELGLEGQPRFIVEHFKDGRTHRHAVWGRIDADTMTAIPADFNYRKHEQAAREIEREFGLIPVESVLVKDRETERPERRTKDWEGFRAQDTGIDPEAMRAEITLLWQEADSGLAFKAALEDAGYILAKGDRRDFCVIDAAGDEHSLARRISGARAAEIRARMADVDRDVLPTVADARAMALEAAEGGGGAIPQAKPETAHSPATDALAAVKAQEARQLGAVAELTPDIEHDLAARFGESFARTLQEAQAGGATGSVVEHAMDNAAPLSADIAASAATDFLPEPRGWRERMRTVWDAALTFLRDETSGTPEEGRGRLARIFDTGRELWHGTHGRGGHELGEGIEGAAELAREFTGLEADAAPEGEASDAGAAPPHGIMRWVDKVTRGAARVGELMSGRSSAAAHRDDSGQVPADSGETEAPAENASAAQEHPAESAHAPAHAHAPPHEHARDTPRPGGDVETPEPDEGPQTEAAPLAGAAAPLDARASFELFDAWPEMEAEDWPQAETEEPDAPQPDEDGPDDGPDLD